MNLFEYIPPQRSSGRISISTGKKAPFYTFHYGTKDADSFLLTSSCWKEILHYYSQHYSTALQIAPNTFASFCPIKLSIWCNGITLTWPWWVMLLIWYTQEESYADVSAWRTRKRLTAQCHVFRRLSVYNLLNFIISAQLCSY